MSFTLGGISTNSLEGVEATPVEYSTLGGLTLDTLETPGRDGRQYGGTRRTYLPFSFDVTIKGRTPNETEERKDAFMRLLDPSIGPRPLVRDTDTEWFYPRVVASDQVDWEKFAWGPGRQVLYRGTVVMETVGDPSAFQLDPHVVTIGGSGTDYLHNIGTTSARPRVVYTVGSSSTSNTRIGIGDFTITLTGSTPAGHVLDLDWENMRFYRYNASGVKQESLVGRMSHYERPTLYQGRTYRLTRTSGGSAVMYPNARRA